MFYGVLSGELSEHTNLTLGYTQQDNNTAGPGRAAAVLHRGLADGLSRVNHDSGAVGVLEHTHSRTAFVELRRELGESWRVTGVLTYNDYREPSKLFYAYGTPDRQTGLGLFGFPGQYDSYYGKSMADLQATGSARLGGRTHQLASGASFARGTNRDYSMDALTGFDPLPDFDTWSGAQVPEPAFGARHQKSDWTDELVRAYATAHLNWTDRLKTIVGLNAISLKSDGDSYGESRARSDNAVTPYLGVVYDLTRELSAYASYNSSGPETSTARQG